MLLTVELLRQELREREVTRARKRARQLRENRQVGVQPDPLKPAHA